MKDIEKTKTDFRLNSTDQSMETRNNPVTTTILGVIIGFLAASVLYSQYLPPWVPGVLAGNPYLFFGLFIVICGLLGFNWGVTDTRVDRTEEDAPKRFPVNIIITFMFMGFLAAAVLFHKFMPSWVPLVFTEYPIVFFSMFVVLGGVLGYFWYKSDQLP